MIAVIKRKRIILIAGREKDLCHSVKCNDLLFDIKQVQ